MQQCLKKILVAQDSFVHLINPDRGFTPTCLTNKICYPNIFCSLVIFLSSIFLFFLCFTVGVLIAPFFAHRLNTQSRQKNLSIT